MLSDLKEYSYELAGKFKVYDVHVVIYHECARGIPEHRGCVMYVTPSHNASADGILEDVKGTIYISYEEIYAIIIDCNMDYDKSLYCISHLFTMMYGYIVYLHNTFINKPVKEYMDWRNIHGKNVNNYNSLISCYPTYSENFDWFVGRCNLTPWKEMMETVGFTKEDCIKCFEYLNAEDNEDEA